MKKVSLLFTALCLSLLLAACGEDVKQPKAVVGQPAPDFSLDDTKGRTWSLMDLKGQVVFINFWATWCPPCRQEMPSMQTIYSELPTDKFQMLTILYNDVPGLGENFAEKFNLTFPILIDPGNKIGHSYGLTGVPETFIIDKQGILREKFIGPVQWDSPGARQMLLKYINQE